MKGSSGAGWTAVFFAYLTFSAWIDDKVSVANAFAVIALAFLALFFLCRSIESRREET